MGACNLTPVEAAGHFAHLTPPLPQALPLEELLRLRALWTSAAPPRLKRSVCVEGRVVGEARTNPL